MTALKYIKLQNSFTEDLPADKLKTNEIRQVYEACYSYVRPQIPKGPELIHVSDDLADILGIDDSSSDSFLNVVSGKEIIDNSMPYAMCYGGHQFGNWAGQLGDGRAINLAEVETENGRWVLQLKGAGETPYSRTADGLAVLRSSIREYLCSEAMHYLGVASTRALSIALSGQEVLRDVLYDGHSAYEKGAVVCRVAPSFIRFGNFEIFSARDDYSTLEKLTNHTIKHHFPELGPPSKQTYLEFFKSVCDKTKAMILNWQRVGFVHGVMNTDNMSILGLTIDYGPYGWLEDYDPGWTPNTTDVQHKRYRFGNQSSVALWNLTRLANALYPLIEDADTLTEVLTTYRDEYKFEYLKMMGSKIGLEIWEKEDEKLIENLTDNLRKSEVDMTILFRSLSKFNTDKPDSHLTLIKSASYLSSEDFEIHCKNWKNWLTQYAKRLEIEVDYKGRAERMNQINPKYVLRNYMAQLAIDEAEKGKFELVNELYNLLKRPYDEQPKLERWFAKRPDWAKERVGCSMLSCSS